MPAMTKQQIVDACRNLAKSAASAFVMATVSPDGKPHAFYMGAAVFDEPFTLYLETFRSSHKVAHLRENPNAELVFASPGFDAVATISGTAAVEESQEIRRRVWDSVPASAKYFESVDSPELLVLKFTASHLQLQVQAEGKMDMQTASL